jgi:hypothetical protein
VKEIDSWDDWDDGDDARGNLRVRKPNRERSHNLARQQRRAEKPRRGHVPTPGRVESRDGTFRCRHCKTIVGPPISGGRHRNHCPICLYSRHVDARSPGDRASNCRSMMTPVGVRARAGGEQELVHLCLGCGIERRNRVAADDNVVAVMRLPVLAPDTRVADERATSLPAS